jgi:hypothetical protein
VSRKIPAYIRDSKIVGSPITYQWDTEIAAELLERENRKLESAVEKLTFKAGFAAGIAITEWIIFRFEGHADLEDAHHRIEAAWAGVIDPAYVISLDKELSGDEDIDDKEIVGGPLEATLYALGEMFNDYRNINIASAERVVTQALLSRHLLPVKKPFEDWLSSNLRKAFKAFPLNEALFNSRTEAYNLSHEEAVPREFFESDFVYTHEAVKAALNAMLKEIDPAKNSYLRSAEEMKSQGFKGKPYAI